MWRPLSLFAHHMHFHSEPHERLLRVTFSIHSDENISLCDGQTQGEDRVSCPSQGTYMDLSGQVEMKLAWNTRTCVPEFLL